MKIYIQLQVERPKFGSGHELRLFGPKVTKYGRGCTASTGGRLGSATKALARGVSRVMSHDPPNED